MTIHNLKLTIHFFREEPFAAAQKLDLIEAADASAVIQRVPISVAATVICAMQASSAAKILLCTPANYTSALFQSLELADIAAMLRNITRAERQTLLELLPTLRQARCSLLISYPEDTVGALVETNVLVLDSHMTVADAMLRVKKQLRFDSHEVLVVTSKRKIFGKVTIFDLIHAQASTLVSAMVNTRVNTVNGLSDVNTVLALDVWKKTDTLAVVNRKHELIGLLRHFDLRASIAKNKKIIRSAQSVSGEIVDAYRSVLTSLSELFISSNTNTR